MRSVLRRVRHWAVGVLLQAILKTARRLSWVRAERLGIKIGNWAFILSGKYRRRTIENIGIAYPDMSDPEKYKLAYSVFANLGKYMTQAMILQELSAERIKTLVHGADMEQRLQKTFQSGRSAMILTGHYCNWELFAARTALIAPLTVLARSNSNPRIQELIDSARNAMGIRVIDRDDPSVGRKMRKLSLEGGHILGILMDQDTRVASIFSPFLGIPARTPSGPAAIAVKDWFDVYIGFIVPGGPLEYEMKLTGPLNIIHAKSKADAIQANTDMFNELISAQITEAPMHWAWLHRRWRHKKPETP